ncbi:MAG: FAD-dependent oxidoreductase [Rhodothermales bacterium]|nr:FAD-dependent oxidoreductase [Rhodothermales bacterium]
MPSHRIAVIGGVAAGPAAAAQAARTDPRADVVLFEQGPEISYGACEMPYVLAGWIDALDDLIVLTPEEFEATRGAKVRVGHAVLGLHPRRHRIDVKDVRTGQVTEERFDKVILAVGARARMPDFDGADAANVFPMRRLTDARRLQRFLAAHPVRHVVILGGGYVGVEMAEAMHARSIRVTILEPQGGLLNRYLDDALRPVIEEEVQRHGVQIRRERAVAFEQDRDGLVRAVRTDRGEKIGCQAVVVAMGVEPNTALARAAGVRVGATGALAVDAGMRTNVPGIWACGDCIEVERVIDGRAIHLPLSPVAFRTARVAAENAARRGQGRPARFPGVCAASAVKVFGLEVAAVGLRLAEAQDAGFDALAHTVRHWSRVAIYPGAERVYVRLVVERRSGRLLGGELVGREGAALRADVLVPLVRAGATVHDLRDLDLIYTPPFAPSLDPLIVAANESIKQLAGSR